MRIVPAMSRAALGTPRGSYGASVTGGSANRRAIMDDMEAKDDPGGEAPGWNESFYALYDWDMMC